jgi:hypothetical protein
MKCEFLPTCGFLVRTNRIEPYTARMIKLSYCEKDKLECARYRLSKNVPEEEIPDNLWPNEGETDF